MNFREAMEKLASGSKVSRHIWKNEFYYMKFDGEVKGFQEELRPYLYNEDTMLSDGWIIPKLDHEKEYKFYDIIHFLKGGMQAKLKHWTDSYIYYDASMCILIARTMQSFSKTPEFESFIAEDWVEL